MCSGCDPLQPSPECRHELTHGRARLHPAPQLREDQRPALRRVHPGAERFDALAVACEVTMLDYHRACPGPAAENRTSTSLAASFDAGLRSAPMANARTRRSPGV